jgi:probable F420-dependent oxidoreductase
MQEQMNEIGFYTLAGAPKSPRDLIDEVHKAEELGIGACFISERFNIKEAATLSGAVGAVSSRIGIATAATNHNTRHPMVTGAFATTMHFLTGGRFSLGLGRGIEVMSKAMGLSPIKTAELEDFVGIMRRVWRGETILGHEGPSGNWPMLRLDPAFDEHIPITFTAFGPNSLAFGGRACDAVVLHTFFSDETTERCVKTVKRAAEEAGRNPDDVRVWSCFATMGDHLPYDVRLKKTVGRMATYLQAYGDLMVRTNDWDPEVLRKFRESEIVGSIAGAIDQVATTEQLEQVAEFIPDAWLAPAASGTPAQCVDAVQGQFDLGCDGVILHGASPTDLEPIVTEYRKRRDAEKFAGLPANPGGKRK